MHRAAVTMLHYNATTVLRCLSFGVLSSENDEMTKDVEAGGNGCVRGRCGMAVAGGGDGTISYFTTTTTEAVLVFVCCGTSSNFL